MENFLPKPNMFKIYKQYENGGQVLIHSEVIRSQLDYKDLLTIANIFGKEGKSVMITYPVHFKSVEYLEVFGSLVGTTYERKCPDLKIGEFFYEYESYVPPFKKRKISHMIRKGAEQSSRIIINNNKGASDRYIVRNVYERLKDKIFIYDIEELWVYERGKIRLLFKKQ